jgi:hypothetical protein
MFVLPSRAGEKPKTTSTNPHQQQSQNPTPEVYELLLSEAFDFPHVERRPSAIRYQERRRFGCPTPLRAGLRRRS